MEKIFMVIIMCIYGECQGMWQQTTYNTMDECLTAVPPVKEYFMEVYPQSDGQIYCMDQENFNEWRESLERGESPRITNLPNIPAI